MRFSRVVHIKVVHSLSLSIHLHGQQPHHFGQTRHIFYVHHVGIRPRVFYRKYPQQNTHTHTTSLSIQKALWLRIIALMCLYTSAEMVGLSSMGRPTMALSVYSLTAGVTLNHNAITCVRSDNTARGPLSNCRGDWNGCSAFSERCGILMGSERRRWSIAPKSLSVEVWVCEFVGVCMDIWLRLMGLLGKCLREFVVGSSRVLTFVGATMKIIACYADRLDGMWANSGVRFVCDAFRCGKRYQCVYAMRVCAKSLLHTSKRNYIT